MAHGRTLSHSLTQALELASGPALVSSCDCRPWWTALHAQAGFLACEAAAVYRPRHPERSAFYKLLDENFERYVQVHEERYERRSGPLRPVVTETVQAYLDCGRLHSGFARVVCPSCRGEHLLAFSCQTRNFCPSCQAKRAALLAERLFTEILAPVPHRHFVFTIPKVLRGLMQRERRLLGVLARCAFQAVGKVYAAMHDGPPGRPGMVLSLQTFGGFANWNAHAHALVTDGLLHEGGTFTPLPCPDQQVLEQVFRVLVIQALQREQRLSEDFAASLLSWRHSGFSAYARQEVPARDQQRIEHIAFYIARPPVRLDAVSIMDTGSVLLTTAPHPRTGATTREIDPLDWVHAVCTQIPDKGQHLVRYFGAYANRVRARYATPEESDAMGSRGALAAGTSIPEEEDDDHTRNRRRSWARLLRKLLEVDPLLCPICRVPMKVIAVIQDPNVIDAILKHRKSGRGQDPFEPRAPPAA